MWASSQLVGDVLTALVVYSGRSTQVHQFGCNPLPGFSRSLLETQSQWPVRHLHHLFDSRKEPCTAVDSTFLVLLCSEPFGTVCKRLKDASC
jgi:hypothetical protein